MCTPINIKTRKVLSQKKMILTSLLKGDRNTLIQFEYRRQTLIEAATDNQQSTLFSPRIKKRISILSSEVKKEKQLQT